MELNGQQVGQKVPGARIRFQSLDYSIYTNGSSSQRFSDICDRLMMSAIHPEAVSAGDFSKQRSNLQFYFVNHLMFFSQPAMVERAWNLASDVHKQSPAKRHVKDLLAATDRQQGFALPQHLINQQQFKEVAFRGGGVDSFLELSRKLLSAVKRRINIVAARSEEHTSE